MTAKAETIAIEDRFATNFTICSVKYANVKFDPTPGQAWADINIVIADSMRAEVGGGLHRNIGIISVNIYEPVNTGTAAGKKKADLAAAVYRGQKFSGITCRSPKIVQVGEIDEWYVINMSVPFYRDEIF
jgi:hypothetical protein